MKRRLTLSVLLLIPLVLSGCLVISDVFSTQLDTIGNVRIDLDACFTQSAGSCTDAGNSLDGDGLAVQPLVAFRIPSAAAAPDGFSTVAGVALAFTRSTGYAQELQRLAPAAAGQYWVGYAATTAVHVVDGSNQGFVVSPQFTLQRGVDGSPFVGPFLYRPVTGARNVSVAQPITRAVSCGTSLFTGTTFDTPPPDGAADAGDTICVDSPSSTDTATNLSRSTRDLGVVASSPVVGTRGGTALVPFVLKYAGSATASANFAVDASTNLSGATATPSQGSLLPATDSSNPINVSVNVPAESSPGTYNVIINARLANGQVRTNTGTLIIRDTTKPTITISLVKGQKTRSLLARGLKLKVKMSEEGSVTFVLTTKLSRTVTLSRKTVGYAGAGTKQVTLTVKKGALSRAMRARMLSLFQVKLTLHASAKDAAGNTRAATKKITLKR